MKTFDIIVVGGGISGSVAAIAAGRMGKSVLLIEKNGYLGGMLTAGGVGPMMTFHAGNKQVVQGITGELIDHMVRRGSSVGHIMDMLGYTATVTPFDAEDLKVVLEEAVLNAGGNILYHTLLGEVQVNDRRIDSVRVVNKDGSSDLSAPVWIDATGDGDLAAWAGVETVLGDGGACQPMTMNLKLYGVDIARLKSYIKANPEEFPNRGDVTVVDHACRLGMGGFVGTFHRAQQAGEITFARESVLLFETNTPGEVIVNTSRIIGKNPTSAWDVSAAEIEGRRQCKELTAYFRGHVPGFEQARVAYTGPQIGVRSSRQLVGNYVLTAEDLMCQQRFADVIAHGGYPIDVHNPHGAGGLNVKLPDGAFYDIPYRCLVTGRVKNLCVVGRCISATPQAQGAIRVSPIAGAIGHAGGMAAALAQADVTKVDVGLLQEKLIAQGAFLSIRR